MDKYGVQQDSEFAKTANSTNDSCPECGEKIQMKGSVCWCPNCGTKPFERKNGDQESRDTD